MIILKDGKPFVGESNLDPAKVQAVVEAGIWGEKELADWGLASCAEFVVPDGKMPVGDARYVQDKDGAWQQEYDVADVVIDPADQRKRDFYADPDVVDFMERIKAASADELIAWVDKSGTEVLKALVKYLVTRIV